MSEICPTCGLPGELCVCESIAKESQVIEVKIDRRKFGKINTIITGIDSKEIDLNDVAKKLKNKFACGGTAKQGVVELQGKHLQNVRKELILMGFSAESIKVIESDFRGRRRN